MTATPVTSPPRLGVADLLARRVVAVTVVLVGAAAGAVTALATIGVG